MGWKGAGSGLGREGRVICDPISQVQKDTLNLNSCSGLGHERDRQTHVAATEPHKTLESTTQANQETRSHTPYIQTHNDTKLIQGLPTSTRGRHSQQATQNTRSTTTEKETTTHRRTVTQRTQTSEEQPRNFPEHNLDDNTTNDHPNTTHHQLHNHTHPKSSNQQHQAPYTMFHPEPHLNTNWMQFLQQQAQTQQRGNTYTRARGGHQLTGTW